MGFPDDVPVLTDGTVTLRAHVEDDLDGICAEANDPLTQELTDVPTPFTPADARGVLETAARAWETESSWSFAVQSSFGAGSCGYSGTVVLHDRGDGVAAIEYSAHPGARGHGVITRAVTLLVDWAFEHGLRSIVWESLAGNIAGRRVAWKTGFTFEGATRGTIPQRGTLQDGWRATLLASDDRAPKSRWREPVTLANARVRLRTLRLDDEQRYLETNNDPESLQWLGTFPFPRDADKFRGHIARRALNWSGGDAVEWAVAAADDDRYVGTVVLFGLTGLDHRSAEVGYRTHPDSRGQGLLKSALLLALGHAFGSEDEGGLGLNRVSLNAGVGNAGSLAVAAGLGFTETGRDRCCYDLYDGSVVDLVRFDLLKDEFANSKQPAS